jgi:hypothetical protein
MAKKNPAIYALLALALGLASVSLVACSTGETAVADTVDASTSSSAVISSSAQNAVTELLGDVDAVNTEVEVPTPIAEKITGVAYGPTETGVLESSVDAERNLLQVKIQGTEGKRVSMKNGGAIRLREGLVAEVFVDPYPTHTLTAWVDLYLHDGNGGEIKDVKVQIDYDMFSMGHGPFYTIADNSPNGHYTFRLDYVMFGPWMQLLDIPDPDLPDVEYKLEVIVVAVP